MTKSEMTFTASMQQAIEFMLDHIVRPRPSSGWPRHSWCNFTWFTKIQMGLITKVDEPQPFHKPNDTVVRRDIKFFLGEDMVAVVTMQGLRDTVMTCWTVQHVAYRLRWGTGGDETEWIRRQLMTTSYSGISPLVAPEG